VRTSELYLFLVASAFAGQIALGQNLSVVGTGFRSSQPLLLSPGQIATLFIAGSGNITSSGRLG
jgi:hypothetical protein